MLVSRLFSDSKELAAAQADDRAHVVPGAIGRHVGKIQAALVILDDADIAIGEWLAMIYGPSTTKAVLAYKQKRKIINRAYQQTADNIVGKMTITQMDKDMLVAQASAGFGAREARRCPQCHIGPPLFGVNTADADLRQSDRRTVTNFTAALVTAPPATGGAGAPATLQPFGPFPQTRGFSTAQNYQMIPVGGSRDFRIVTHDEPVILSGTMGLAGTCELVSATNFNRNTEDKNFPLPSVVPKNATAVVRIRAKSEKRAVLGLFTGDSKPITEVTLSFKTLLPITLSTMLLEDALRTTTRTKATVTSLVTKVRSYYSEMCNVLLLPEPEVGRIKVDADLGAVINVDNTANMARVLVAMKEQAAVKRLNVVFSWNIESASHPDQLLNGLDILGVGTPNIIVEDPDSPGFDANRDSNILAHEIGHGLGLPHEPVEFDNLMSDSTDTFGAEMLGTQIDKVNPSGLRP
jgi:hypothetical protein